MNASPLLAEFERLSEAPSAVARLRSLVLDLAIRGKLVEQDPSEGAAIDLLESIGREKAKLAERPIANRGFQHLETPGPLPLPGTWCWSDLSQVGFIGPHNRADDDYLASFVPMSSVPSEYGLGCAHEVRAWGEIKKGYTHFANGDVGLAKITPCFENRKSTIFRNLTGGIGAGTTELHVVRPVLVNPDYLLIFLKSSVFVESGVPLMTGTAGQKRVPADYFASAPLPLPPLGEQSRIVAKVQELMELCDQLAAAQTEREARRDTVRNASLHRLTPPDGDAKPASVDVQFFLDVSPRLITKPEHIPALRETILDLAVRGSFVRPDPADEPVAHTLARAGAIRADTSRNDRRADADNQELLAAEFRWSIPSTWAWCGLADLVLFIDYRGKTPSKTASGIRLLTAKNVRRGSINREPSEFISEDEFDRWMTRGLPRVDDVLFTTEAPLGNASTIRIQERVALAQRLIAFRSYGAIDPDFLVLHLLSPQFQTILDRTATGLTAKGIKAAKLKRLPIAVPPLAEQRRIVATANQLTTLCDQLEAALASAQGGRARLLEALLHEALEGSALQTPVRTGTAV